MEPLLPFTGLRPGSGRGFCDPVVGEAGDFHEAVEMLVKEDRDLLLLDIYLSGLDGLVVLQEAKRLRPETAVLVVSGYPEVEFAIRSFKLGAPGYLCKTEAPEALLAAVQQILAGRKYVDASLAERLASIIGAGCPAAHNTLSRDQGPARPA